jgi:hypothetical protein
MAGHASRRARAGRAVVSRAREPGAADTVNDVKPTTARLLAAVLAVAAGLAVLVSLAGPASARPVAPAASAPAHPVVIIGIPGLRWTDISPASTPALWRLAGRGSVGSLVVSAVRTLTCPADAWLTLNSGTRAIGPRSPSGACTALPPVSVSRTGTTPGQRAAPGQGTAASTGAACGTSVDGAAAQVPALTGPRGIEAANVRFSYHPCWGLLAAAAGPGNCATALGPGAALALASTSGGVASYLPQVPRAIRSGREACPLTVADLGALPAAGRSGTPAAQARAAAVRAADRSAGRLIAAAPAGAIVVVAGLGDDSAPHLRAIIVSGPGYRAGLLRAVSTRQPGLVLITDLTPTVFGWRGRAIPAPAAPYVVGSPITATGRGSLPAAVRTLIGQDTAAHVYVGTLVPFFMIYGFGEGVVFGLIALILCGSAPERRRRRRSAYRVAAMIAGAVPAGTFLASLVPWPVLPHPALLLYGLGLAWTAVIAAAALAGPWRRDPLGPPGFIGAVTIAVIGVDVMTGSHLQLGTPFGLSALAAGRFYGVGNNALGVYALGGLLCAAWAGSALARRTGSRGRAVAAAGAIALFTVVAAGWPGFGAKVGGTIAMVPGFLVVLAALAGIRITPRRAVVVAVSGLVLIAVFAVISYKIPAAGVSDVGAFVGRVGNGGAGPILRRKIDANIGSLTENPFTPIIPVIVVVTGLMLAWPDRLRLRTVALAMRAQPLLRPLLSAMWLVAVLGWLANDSGVTVTASALPLALPLVIAIVTGIAEQEAAGMSDVGAHDRTAPRRTGRVNL